MIGLESMLTEMAASVMAQRQILVARGHCTEQQFDQARLKHYSELAAAPRVILDETLLQIQSGLASVEDAMVNAGVCTAEDIRRAQLQAVSNMDQSFAEFMDERDGQGDGEPDD